MYFFFQAEDGIRDKATPLMTPAVLLEREEAPPMADDKPPKITKQDLTRLEQLREERYQLRAARHNADGAPPPPPPPPPKRGTNPPPPTGKGVPEPDHRRPRLDRQVPRLLRHQ